MSWLLKIVEGPMKGAEVALVDGLKVKVGSGDSCDIVVADRSLDEVAFELDVTEGGVTLTRPSGETQVLVPFEVVAFETTAIAVGPAEGKWKSLVWPKPVETVPPPSPATGADKEEKREGKESETTAEEAPRARTHRGTKGRRGVGCLVALVILVLLGFAVWYFWPKVVEKCPKAEDCRVTICDKMRAWCAVGCEKTSDAARRGYAWTRGQFEKPEPVPVVVPTLEEIAADHGLCLETNDVVKTLKGNCARRTERFAIRALALASDPSVKFDLTDDESLKTAADELLFVVTEGAVKAVSASNRVVTLVGAQPTAAQFEKVVRSLNADVPGIERLVTSGVRIGRSATPVESSAGTDAVASDTTDSAVAPQVKAVARRDYPIAGLLVSPYPCVVMRNGLRLAEGAQIGTSVIERIEADRLVLRDGTVTFEWRP